MPNLTLQVAANTDDCIRSSHATYFAHDSTSFYAGYLDGAFTDFGSAARFLNVTIPPKAIITLAKLILTCRIERLGEVVNSRCRAERNVTPLTFSTVADFNARTWTNTHVHWNAIPVWAAEESSANTTSPDLSACIQEVIELPGWASGNAVVVLWDDFEQLSDQEDNHARQAYSYNGSATKAPKLYIEYTIPAPSGGSPVQALMAGVI